MEVVKRYYIIITGIVQGVGFRPFIYKLAKSLSLFGWVNNSSQGVIIDIEGKENHVKNFLENLKINAPALSNIKDISIKEEPLAGFQEFKIINSVISDVKNIYISPDITI